MKRCLVVCGVVWGGLFASAEARGTERSLRAASLGPVVDAPDGRSEMELVTFDAGVVATLQSLAPGESLRVDDWPVTPGRRATVHLRRFDIYAPDAKIVVIENGVAREEPRSRLAFFQGAVADGLEAGSRLVTWLDPETGRVGGFVAATRGTILLEPSLRDEREVTRVLPSDALPEAGPGLAWSCGVTEEGEDLPWREEMRRAREVATLVQPGSVAALGTLTKTAVIAFDTDAEYLDLRFDNSASAATTHIAQLVAGMSLIYERDVASVSGNGVRILQGYTILRIGEASDPYTDTVGSADSAKLNEFRNYWNAHYPDTVVRRALAALLSGKQGNGLSASGIASVAALCSGAGYSIDQLFTYPVSVTTDLGILAHEVGHNFGAFHTHSCYYGTPPIDTCVTPEGSCTPATGCPGLQFFNLVGTNGTLMSYCHIAGCSPRNLVFHPRSVTDNPADPYFVDSVLQEVANAGCLASLSGGVVPPAPTVSSVSPATGPLSGGTSLTITGTNFVNGATVAFVELPSNNVFGSPAAKAAGSVTFNNATQLTVTTPSATNTGAVDVVVMNPDRQTATRASGFTYATGPVVLSLLGVSPKSGPAGGGTAITLTGTGFLAGAGVTVRGVAAGSVVVASSGTITANTPAGAIGPADVVVTNPGGATATLPGGFVYTATGGATRLYTITPCRLVDTRNPTGPFGGPALAAGAVRSFTVPSGSCAVPADAAAVSLNITVADPTTPGTLTFFPGSGTVPGTNTISFVPGKNRANNVTMGVVGGVLSVRDFQASGTVNLIVDVNGYYR
ncbi:MAG: IPT/TIG domain-containing protein [Thermoanaerobaculia bacterium]